ncbi:hypothetical protein [Halpernia frigidisoli]|uniref:Uncharacterized protein n=1 Tax=Halpernia frigidisoli TaxID=1125876 RepID=A0A1I3F7K8_9FLAO|nr:hypothetical protein [Halpernia frigidisoli]SFI07197.1 hypothetical protein SAMN05443292_1201 [Halpernia frigidisoli]
MKKIFTILSLSFITFASAQTNAFKGADFDNFADFTASLNKYGLKDYARQGVGEGINSSGDLKIIGNPAGNDYIFTAKATETLPAKIKEITFMLKGSAAKSLSVNVYKTDGTFYKFNLGDVRKDMTVQDSETNSYTGTIFTKDKFVKITLDCSKLTDINTNAASNFFAVKVGKGADYNLDIDDVKVIAGN